MSDQSPLIRDLRRRLKTTERALRERNGRIAELEGQDRQRTQQDERERVAYFMAKEAGLPEAGTKLMLTFAREQDGDLKEFFRTVSGVYEAEAVDG